MRTSLRPLAGTVAALTLVATAGCGGDDSGTSASEFPTKTLRIMAPAAPGGGWDQTSRTAQQALKEGQVVRKDVEVFNVPGAGGTIGLARLVNEKGNGHLLMTMGLVMVGAVETNKSKATLDQVTPIARLTTEYEAVVVPASSPYRTLQDLTAAWKENPRALAVAGGSAGGTDQILAGLMAKAAGIDPTQVNYVAFSGGGEALAAILGGKVAMGISGLGEFTDQVKAGKLRLLAVSSGERIEGADAPTLKEGGLDVELSNWRGMVAPPGLSEGDRAGLENVVTKLHDSQQWKDALAKNGWDDAFATGSEFASFLDSEQTRVKTVLTELGLTS